MDNGHPQISTQWDVTRMLVISPIILLMAFDVLEVQKTYDFLRLMVRPETIENLFKQFIIFLACCSLASPKIIKSSEKKKRREIPTLPWLRVIGFQFPFDISF